MLNICCKLRPRGFPEGAGSADFAFFDFSGHLPQAQVVAAAARISCWRPTTASMQVLQRPRMKRCKVHVEYKYIHIHISHSIS